MTQDAARVLKPALMGARGTVKREIAQGISHLYQTSGNNLFVVLRPEGQQLVVVAVAGSGIRQSRQQIIDFAVANNFQTIRFHTQHPERLTKGLAGLPVQLVERRRVLLGNDELVYQLELNHGYF